MPVRAPQPSKLELSWAPGPIANSRFTPAEMAQIKVDSVPADIKEAVAKVAPGWQITDCGTDMDPGLRAEWRPEERALRSPARRAHRLRAEQEDQGARRQEDHAAAGRRARPARRLRPDRARGRQGTVAQASEPATSTEVRGSNRRWTCPLSRASEVKMELINQPTGWAFEAAYWAEIAIVSE